MNSPLPLIFVSYSPISASAFQLPRCHRKKVYYPMFPVPSFPTMNFAVFLGLKADVSVLLSQPHTALLKGELWVSPHQVIYPSVRLFIQNFFPSTSATDLKPVKINSDVPLDQPGQLSKSIGSTKLFHLVNSFVPLGQLSCSIGSTQLFH